MTAPAESRFRRFRDIWRFMVPGWLASGDGEKVQYVEGLMLDAFLEACHQTARLMLPSVAPSDALDRIGRDRAIPRGFAEPEASYRERLIRWRYPRGHRIRGNATGLLEQIAAVFGNAVDALQTIDARGTRYTWAEDADGGTTVERGVAWNWDGSALLPNWARFYVVVKPTGARRNTTWAESEAASETWAASEASGESWASPDIHTGQLQAIRTLCKVGRLSWTPAGRRPVYCVVWFDGDAYPAPDGTWNDWSARPPFTHAFFPLHASIE